MAKKKSHVIFVFIIFFLAIISVSLFILIPKIINRIEIDHYDLGSWSEDPQSGYAQLDEKDQKTYKRIVKSISEFNTEIDLTGFDTSLSKIDEIFFCIQRDHPEFFWAENYSASADQQTQIISSITIENNCTDEERQKKQARIDKAVEQIIQQIPANADEYHQVLAVHDAIVSSTKYGNISPDNQNICSVLIDGVSVCSGYSKTFQYILRELGIFSTVISGKSKGESHAWNLVKIDGDYYYIDITWDDPADEIHFPENMILHDYFCITTEEISRDHTFSAKYQEPCFCMATKNNYFVRNKRIFDSVEAYVDGAVYAVSNGKKTFYGKLTSPDMISTVIGELQNRLASYTTGFSYSKNETIGTLLIKIE